MKNALKWMALHPVAANMTMAIVLIAGALSAVALPQTTFPEFEIDTVQIVVPYQGAAPDEIVQSVIRPIEDQLSSIDGIDEINATARENSGSVNVSFLAGEDIVEKLDEVKTEIDRITVFPDDADEPVVVRAGNNTRVLELAIHGNTSLDLLTLTAERLKDELALLNGVSFIETANIPDRELYIEFERETLEAFGFTMRDIADIVRANSLELPGGDIDSAELSVPIRTLGRNFDTSDYANIVVRTGDNGSQLLLGDIATIRDDFSDDDLVQQFGGERAVTVNVFRVGDEQVLDVAEQVRSYINTSFEPSLPQGVSVTIWQDESEVLQSRLDLLIKNAFTGLVLVVICLALFLDIRLAFFSAANIAIAFAGTFIAMRVLDVSINMISLFGFILAIGIVVDNAIVVSEKIFKNAEDGEKPQPAAVSGVTRVAVPVIFSALTTIVAFTPLMQMPAPLGDFLVDIPIIVIMVLTLSLLQSLFVLPNNLSRVNFGKDYKQPLALMPLVWLRRGVDAALQWFIRGPLDAALRFAMKRFLIPIAGVIAAMVMTFGLMAHGYVKFEFFPSIDGEYVTANISLVEGTSLTRTEQVAARVREAAETAAEKMANDKGMAQPIIVDINMTIGIGAGDSGPFGGAAPVGSSKSAIVVQIIQPEQRDWPASEFETRWISEIGDIAGLDSLTVASSLVDAGKPIALELSVPDGVAIEPVINDISNQFRAIPGVFGIQDTASAGRLEYRLALREEARQYGITLNDLATQVRSGFFGLEATRVQRGSDDVQVTVRLVDEDRETLDDILKTDIRTQSGALIPLSVVATIEQGVAPTEITRRNGRTITTVTADVDTAVITAQEANAIIRADVIPLLADRYAGLIIDFGGEQRTQGETQEALGNATGIALLIIFALLALIFRSYAQPLVVMIAIPLGLIGAVLGHYVIGVSLGLLSIFGIIGLAGVVINNSLVMIDLYNENLAKGMDTRTAVIEGTKDRFRPILLTSLTTFLGIYPLITETSIQAQFLIPLAVSIGFGILFGTIIITLAIPAVFILMSYVTFSFKSPEEKKPKIEEASFEHERAQKKRGENDDAPFEMPVAAE
ncbi:MAG: efflux RND transporter permease subunit [Pseudomonadota bacterium]